LTAKDIEQILVLAQGVISLDTPVGKNEYDDFEETIGNFVVDPAPGPEEICLQKARRESLEKYMEMYLREKDMKILRLRHGFEDGHCYSLDEIGKKLCLTRERVRQIEARAIRKLRLKFMAKGLTEEDI
jgi:RNA polymerase primary sigma factor